MEERKAAAEALAREKTQEEWESQQMQREDIDVKDEDMEEEASDF